MPCAEMPCAEMQCAEMPCAEMRCVLSQAPPRQGLLVGSVYWEHTGLKLHSGGGNAVWQGPTYPNITTNFSANADTKLTCGRGGCLYDVVADMGEHLDLALERPAEVARLAAAREAMEGRAWELSRGKSDPAACAAIDQRGGFWGPWID
jgi:hypothetical protein